VELTRCCADCGIACEEVGLVTGQVLGEGDGWAGKPFEGFEANADAVAFWGAIGCCERCQDCPRCRSI
jgi:hypothetical protein